MNILAIESAVADGSIALIRDGEPSIVHEGNGASRAERILPIISELLEVGGISKHQLELIAVSRGPGSYSGIRIGMSIAQGLRDALAIPCVGVPVLTAMGAGFPAGTPAVCAVPVGKNDVGWQLFDAGFEVRPPQLTSLTTFLSMLAAASGRTLFASHDILIRVEASLADVASLDAGKNLAEYVGRFAARSDAVGETMHPIYLKNQDSPPRAF